MALLKNAAQAIRESGRISVRTTREDQNALIVVADTGVGISEEDQRELFDVKFSAEGPRVRLRMGLATVASVVAKHKGQIQVSSKLGEGSEFSVRLPLA